MFNPNARSRDILGFFILATASLGIGYTLDQFRDTPLPLAYESKEQRLKSAVKRLEGPTTAPKKKESIHLPAVVSIKELQQIQKNQQALLFDARPEIFHRLGHIPGALSLPREDFENAYLAYKEKLESDKSQPMIVYCSGVSCEDASLVQKSLASLGYSNIAVFSGGWSEWEQSGLPQETKQ